MHNLPTSFTRSLDCWGFFLSVVHRILCISLIESRISWDSQLGRTYVGGAQISLPMKNYPALQVSEQASERSSFPFRRTITTRSIITSIYTSIYCPYNLYLYVYLSCSSSLMSQRIRSIAANLFVTHLRVRVVFFSVVKVSKFWI